MNSSREAKIEKTLFTKSNTGRVLFGIVFKRTKKLPKNQW